jgi:Dolichyl-phosphate-mannose-protein mannosyltransferase
MFHTRLCNQKNSHTRKSLTSLLQVKMNCRKHLRPLPIIFLSLPNIAFTNRFSTNIIMVSPNVSIKKFRQWKSLLPGVVLLVICIFIALSVYKDYGISWDENAQRKIGALTYDYITKGDKTLLTYEMRGLGTGFELPLIYVEKWLGYEDRHDIFPARHLVTHLFFLIGVFCGYILALRLFKNQFLACLTFLMLAFHPRIYAHSFFNTKDIPFLAAVLIALLIAQVAFEKNKALWFLLLGLTCGYATSIRAMGVIFAPIISISVDRYDQVSC